jgi:hypothetical protein
MAFKQPCFIRKNTPELRKKLEELGYENRGKVRYYGEPIYIYCEMDIFYTSPCKLKIPDNYIIDCGTNEELFIAIASLRDDSDINQWFVMDVEEYMNINQGDWFIATDRTKGKHIGTQIDPMYCHKATIEEIIEHFKK